MVKCELCERDFKDLAGLSGHKRMSHPDAVPVASKELKALLLELLERVRVLEVTMDQTIVLEVLDHGDKQSKEKVLRLLDREKWFEGAPST